MEVLLTTGVTFLLMGLVLVAIFAILSLIWINESRFVFLVFFSIFNINIGVVMAGLVLIVLYLLN